MIDWVSKTFNTNVKIYEGILNTRQSDDTILKLGAVVGQYDQFKLAGENPGGQGTPRRLLLLILKRAP